MGRKVCILASLILLSLTWSGLAQPLSQKPKRIYITLDVSESMAGNKYVMANYASQVISAFAGPDDEIRLYYFGQVQELDSVLKPFESLDRQKKRTYNEVSDLTRFLKDYQPLPHYEDWLFIIGDGDWSMKKGQYDSQTEFEATWKKIKASPWFGDGRLRVCYLQTGNDVTEQTVFTDSLSVLSTRPGHPAIDIRKSDDSAESVLENCLYFANRILGFSIESIAIGQAGSRCITFKSEFPLDRFVLMYQSVSSGKPEVASAGFGSVSIPVESILMKGTPSTDPLLGSAGGPLLNGAVWEIQYPAGIPADEEIRVCFNQDVDAANLRLYPYVDVSLQMLPFTEEMDSLLRTGPEVFKISDQEERILVQLRATDKHGNKFPPALMQKMDVKIGVDGEEIPAVFSSADTAFQVLLDMPADTISYFSMVESPGYFSRITPSQTVMKSADLRAPEQVPLITLPEQSFSPVSFASIIDGNGFGGQVSDSLFLEIASFATFDEQDLDDHVHYPFLGKAGFTLSPDGSLSFTHVPKSDWCECAYPDAMQYTVTLRSSQGILYDGKIYEGFRIPVTIPVEKRGWWSRCKFYVIAILCFFAFLLYLLALLKKKRFHRGARLKVSYPTEDSPKEVERSGKPLREPGTWAWINRWFNPFADERRTVSFSRPRTGSLTFYATGSKNRIALKESCFNPKTMTIPNHVPSAQKGKGNKHGRISVSSGSQIEIKQVQGGSTTRLGHLKYVNEGKDTEGGFSTFVALLMTVCIGIMGLLVFILVKGL